MNVNTATIGTNLQRAKMKKAHRSKQKTRQGIGATSRNSRVATLEKQSAVTRGLQTAQRWSQTRAARVEELHKQVEAGTYAVDSMALAERMLQINTHFLEENGD